jgi:hypothetical protein
MLDAYLESQGSNFSTLSLNLLCGILRNKYYLLHEYEHIQPFCDCIRTILANIRAQAKLTAPHIKINTLFKVGLN